MSRLRFIATVSVRLLAAASLATTALAAEWFVATSGNDRAAGDAPTAAFATVGKGASVLKAGDTLTILPGEYAEAVVVRKLVGTKERPVTIRAQRPGTVLLRGDVEVADWQALAEREGVFVATLTTAVEGVADPR